MTDLYPARIDGVIEARELSVGRGVVVEAGVLITGNDGPASRVVLADFSYVGRLTRIIAPEFLLGDYSKVHNFTIGLGGQPLRIGRNCWIGGDTILDCVGGLDIDDNVGIGAQSQIWTHIQFGDIVEGCRFHSKAYVHIEKDAWFVGHCIVSPVRIGERSMALAGSVVTKEMLCNHIYAGVPAEDVTHKLGSQFETRTVEEKAVRLQSMIDEFTRQHPQHQGELLVARSPQDIQPGVCCFDVSRRVYTKTYSPAEVAFLKTYTPLIKFTPDGEPPFFVARCAD